MAARIEVVLGPFKGWQYRFRGTEVRIGRGPRDGVKVQDPAWGNGCIRLQDAANGYRVTNEMPHPVYLDGEVLPEGSSRTWFPGSRLQPTAATVLVLHVDDADTNAAIPHHGILAIPPAGGAAARRGPQYATVALLLLAAAGSLVLGPAPAPAEKSPVEMAHCCAKVEEDLNDLRQGEAGRVLRLLKDARFYEARPRPGKALANYLAAREELDRWWIHRHEDTGPCISNAREYVAAKIAELANRHGWPRAGEVN
jgi:hypothetical protein